MPRQEAEKRVVWFRQGSWQVANKTSQVQAVVKAGSNQSSQGNPGRQRSCNLTGKYYSSLHNVKLVTGHTLTNSKADTLIPFWSREHLVSFQGNFEGPDRDSASPSWICEYHVLAGIISTITEMQ